MVESAEKTRNRLVLPLEAVGRGKKTRDLPALLGTLTAIIIMAQEGSFGGPAVGAPVEPVDSLAAVQVPSLMPFKIMHHASD